MWININNIQFRLEKEQEKKTRGKFHEECFLGKIKTL